jgi:DNA-binding NtrC family response regulator
MMQRILFVSDGSIDQSLRTALEERRFEIAESNSNQALAQLADGSFGLLIINLGDATEAVGLLKHVRASAPLRNLLTLVIAEWGTGQPALALSEGVEAFEPAPIDTPRLIAAVEKLLRPRMVMTATASTTDGESDE